MVLGNIQLIKIKRRVAARIFLLLLTGVCIFLFIQYEMSNKPKAANSQKTTPATAEVVSESEERAELLPEEKKSKVFALEGKVVETEEQLTAPDSAEKPKKISFNYGIDDSTGQGNVRAVTAKAGVDLKVTERAAVGVEVSKKIHDTQDAAAWNQKAEDENEAKVKYKLSF